MGEFEELASEGGDGGLCLDRHCGVKIGMVVSFKSNSMVK